MDEFIDIVNLKGEPMGDYSLKSVAHQNGILHASVHIWFYTKNGQILIQKRNSKMTFMVFDYEISGLNHKTDRVLSTRAIRINDNTIQIKNIFERYLEQEKITHKSVVVH